MQKITRESIENFRRYLLGEEKAEATLEKYVRDVTAFWKWLDGRTVEKTVVLEYKKSLLGQYAPRSANSMLSSINSFFAYMDWHACKVKTFKIQKQIFARKEKELTRAEYARLLSAAKKKQNEKLYMLMQTICSTGIRVSELQYITKESVEKEEATIRCKGKMLH